MNDQPSTLPEGSMPIRSLERLVDLCDQLELGWRKGEEIQGEDLLKDWSAEDRDKILPRLLSLELEIRRSRGQEVEIADFLARFPGKSGMIRQIFANENSPSIFGKIFRSSGRVLDG